MSTVTGITPEMIVALCLLLLTVVLLITELVRIDVAAVVILVLLGFAGALPGVQPLIPTNELFNGFSSNAVMSIVATMIMGAGLDRTGIMSHVANGILRGNDHSERRITILLSATGAVVSGFVQNIGAAALFLPVANRVARIANIPPSKLLMPMGFAIILGGSVTMVGSSSLILLNDLIVSSNKSLPADKQMQVFGLFDVAPVGVALTFCGIVLFALLGKYLLPTVKNSRRPRTTRTNDYFQRIYSISGEMYELQATIDSPLVGMTILQIERSLQHVPLILAIKSDDKTTVVPSGKDVIWVDSFLGVMCDKRQLVRFARRYKLRIVKRENHFASVMNAQESGVAEIVVPPGSALVGQSVSELRLHSETDLSVLRIYRAGYVLDEGYREVPLQGGDTLVVHIAWSVLKRLRENHQDFAVVTDQLDEDLRPSKMRHAIFFFVAAMLLVLFSDFRISLSLLFGAIGMVVSGVISMDEAYRAVSWKTVFLLGSLIPLGQAFELSGTAAWISGHVLSHLNGVATWELQVVVAALATLFSLFMSNVGATVLLVPLAVNMALATGADPAMFALTVGVATSNSFLLPTHQVNALIMGPGGYRVADFLRVGSVMTVMFMVVSIAVLNWMY